jgi:hypothetical protein
VLRVLANLLNLPGAEYDSSEQSREALRLVSGSRIDTGPAPGTAVPDPELAAEGSWVDVPPYQIDALVRGSDALSRTKDGRMVRTVI